MNRRKAKLRWAGIGLVWDADDGPLDAPAEPVTVIHVHYHFHGPADPGQAARVIQAAPERAAITEGEQE